MINEEEIPGDALEPLARSLQHCMQDLREIIEEAKPSVLQLFGFAQAVENHLDRSLRDTGGETRWELVDETDGLIDTLDKTLRIALFRITQEAINNAARHAQAGHILVRLRSQALGVVIEVSDDGRGMTRPQRRSGGGIDNMMTRARLISAKFTLGPCREGKGTVVRVQLPVGPAKPKIAGDVQ